MAGAQGKTADLQVSLLSSPEPGAVAMLQLSCSSPAVLSAVLAEFTGRPVGSPQRLLWRPLAGVDDGLVMWEPGYALIMPHGGPRVVQRLLERLVALGAQVQPHPPAETVYPEAATPLEAAMLAAMAMAASPAALDLLAAQPARWQAWWRGERSLAAVIGEPLDALLVPPTVVVAGQPNVGKSTLTNHLLGRSAALVADLPGTTRDWVAGRVELPLPWSGSDAFLAVRWLDTPGLRSSDDAIEQRAIDLARGVMASARVLIAMRSPELDWPETGALPREPDLWVENKVDLSAGSPALPEGGDHPARPLRIGAREGLGIAALQRAIVQRLGLDREPGTGPWAFCETLRRLGRGEVSGADWFEGAWSQDRAD